MVCRARLVQELHRAGSSTPPPPWVLLVTGPWSQTQLRVCFRDLPKKVGGRGGLEKQSLWLGTGAGPTLARSKACHRSLAREALVTETLASGVSGEGVGGGFALGPWLWVVMVGPKVSESQTQGCRGQPKAQRGDARLAARTACWRPGWDVQPQNLSGLDSLPRSFLHPTEALIGKEWSSDTGGAREDASAG